MSTSGDGGVQTVELTGLVMSVWDPLVPPLDETSLKLLSAYVTQDKPMTLYRAARLAELSFSLAYKKGLVLRELGLLSVVNGSSYYSTVKGCIAAYTRGLLSRGEFLACVRRIWRVPPSMASDEELLSFLHILGLVMGDRGLDIVKAAIYRFDESSMQVFRIYLSEVVPKFLMGVSVREAIEELAEKLSVKPWILVQAFKVAIKGILSLIPPTLVTKNHKILAVAYGDTLKPIAVVCGKNGCSHYEEELGLTCPLVAREMPRLSPARER